MDVLIRLVSRLVWLLLSNLTSTRFQILYLLRRLDAVNSWSQPYSSTMPRKRSIHGTSSPYIITVSLTAGIAFALGHHFFYNNLHGAPVSSGEYDLGIGSVSPQQLNVAGGTALSFLCKACLVVAISTTYVQLFWRNVAHCKDGNTLQTLDTWYSALDDLSFVGKPWAWWRNPLLSLVAAVVWYGIALISMALDMTGHS